MFPFIERCKDTQLINKECDMTVGRNTGFNHKVTLEGCFGCGTMVRFVSESGSKFVSQTQCIGSALAAHTLRLRLSDGNSHGNT